MVREHLVESIEAAFAIGVFERLHFLEQIRMTADRTLAELDQRAGDDIGAFHRDGDRHAPIEAAEKIQRPFDDGLATVHVHGVAHHDPHAFGGLRLHDGGDHRRMMAVVERRAGHAPRGIEQISGGGDAAKLLLDRLEFGDRHVGDCLRDHRRRRLGLALAENAAPAADNDGSEMPRPAASALINIFQPLPTCIDAADDIVDRDEEGVVAPVRPVLGVTCIAGR